MPLNPGHGRARRAGVLLLVLLVAAAAWALTGRSEEPVPAANRSRPTPDELSSRLPFSRLLYAATDTRTRIAQAQRQLVSACMAGRGFHYEPAPLVNGTGRSAERPTPFGLESLAPSAPVPTGAGPSETPVSEAFLLALYGDPDDRISAEGEAFQVSRPANGCQAESERRLLGTERLRWLELRILLGDGERAARERLEDDPTFRTANARWRECMRVAGFDYSDPVALLHALPRDTEVTTHAAARTDVRCKEDTDYLSTAYARLHAAQQTWLDRHADAVDAWNALERRQDAAAREVLHVR